MDIQMIDPPRPGVISFWSTICRAAACAVCVGPDYGCGSHLAYMPWPASYAPVANAGVCKGCQQSPLYSELLWVGCYGGRAAADPAAAPALHPLGKKPPCRPALMHKFGNGWRSKNLTELPLCCAYQKDALEVDPHNLIPFLPLHLKKVGCPQHGSIADRGQRRRSAATPPQPSAAPEPCRPHRTHRTQWRCRA
jgi:hypothetical protein